MDSLLLHSLFCILIIESIRYYLVAMYEAVVILVGEVFVFVVGVFVGVVRFAFILFFLYDDIL